MFENADQLFEFVDESDDQLFEMVLENAISDVCLYEDEYIIHTLDKYIEMLETDEINEEFEEKLSNVIAPYFMTAASFYEGVILTEMKMKGKKAGKKPLLTRARLKRGAKKIIKSIKKGFAGASKWAKGTKLGKKAQAAYASGLMKASKKLSGRAVKINKRLEG